MGHRINPSWWTDHFTCPPSLTLHNKNFSFKTNLGFDGGKKRVTSTTIWQTNELATTNLQYGLSVYQYILRRYIILSDYVKLFWCKYALFKIKCKEILFYIYIYINCDIGLSKTQLFFTKQMSKLLTLNESDCKN